MRDEPIDAWRGSNTSFLALGGNLDFAQFLDPSSGRRLSQLYEFLGRGNKPPSFEIHYVVNPFSLEYGSENCAKSR